MLNSLTGYRGNSALEIGVGSGIILQELCKSFSLVVGTDIHLDALSFCNRLDDRKGDLVCCDGVSALAPSQKYDLIVSNPPYLPYDSNNIYDRTIYGGVTGSELALEFIKSATNLLEYRGAVLVLLSSLSNLPRIYKELESLGLSRRTVSRKRLFFESLSVEEIRICHKPLRSAI
jgi:methylase of polypeptide subunit release factors